MTHSRFSIGNPVSIFMIAVISLFSARTAFAQCEGVYFKPTAKTPTDSRVQFSPLQDDIAGDFNGDGKLDLVGIEVSGPNIYNKIFIYPGDGAGRFGTRTEINLPESLNNYYGSYFVRDFNADGKMDLIVGTVSNALVYLNDGTGAFAPPPATFGAGSIVNVVDINNDSRMDLITGSGTNVAYRLGNANGTFGAPVSLPQLSYIGRLAGDFDGDGDTDFGVVDFSSSIPAFKVLYNQGSGTFVIGTQSVALDGNGNIRAEHVKDLNNDGKPDVIISYFGSLPKSMILLNQGNGSFTRTDNILSSSPVISSTEIGDYNGDGFVDLLNLIHTQPGTYSSGYIISLNNGAGAFTQRTYPIGGLDSYDDRSVGDFNGDGKADLIRINNFTPSGQPATIFNETQITVKTSVCSNFGQPKIVDFDRDRRTDQALYRASDGRWRVLPSSGITFNQFNLGGAPNDQLVPGDYDGDGKTDAGYVRSGYWYIRLSSNNVQAQDAFGASTDKFVPADYDGDGRTDLAVYRPSTGAWYFKTSSTGGQISGLQFGISEDIPVVEDYDGDGKADVAVFRPSQGYWYVLRSSNGSVYGAQWGLGTDEPHPADYDGDGKADLTVRRRSTGYWYFLRSFNNQTGAIPFGIAEDIVQIGDWDGNGVMDIGVYRPSTSRWYSSTVGGAFFPALGNADETPISTIQR